jgi:hypothetical protein
MDLAIKSSRFRAGLLIVPGVLALVIVAWGAAFSLERGLAWKCPSIALLGLPCPSCGSTRAFAALARFELLDAIQFNPLLVTGLCLLLVAPLLKWRWEHWDNRAWFIFGAAVGLNWLYLLLFLPR